MVMNHSVYANSVSEGFVTVPNPLYNETELFSYPAKKDYTSKGSVISVVDKSTGKVRQYPYIHQAAWVISGLPNGEYEVSITMLSGNVKPIHEFSVHHWPLSQALGLFALGGILFVALLTTIVTSGRVNQES
jgi:hypothetical protein